MGAPTMTDLQHQGLNGLTIPGRILKFLEQHANVGFAGTRSRELVPYGHRVSGWLIEARRSTLTALIAESSTANLVESLQDNGEFALTVEEFPSHETYQFKGQYVSHRAIEPEDLEVADRTRRRFLKSVRHLYPDSLGPLLNSLFQTPGVAVEFEVREIFLQTPGPAAGTRLAPPSQEVP